MFGVRRHEDVTAAATVRGELARLYDKEAPRVPVSMDFTLTEGESRLTVRDERHSVTITGPGGQRAHTRALDAARAKEQLTKTGGTPYAPAAVTIAIDEHPTLPAAALNALRRQALEQLTVKRGTFTPIACDSAARPTPLPAIAPGPVRRFARLADSAQYSPALGADAVILPLATPPARIAAIAATLPVGVEIPRGLFGQEATALQQLAAAKAAGARWALCGNAGAIPLAQQAGLSSLGGFGLNLANREALAFYAERGLAMATLSMELTVGQLGRLLPAPLPVALLVYGHQPLMLTRNCPRRCATGSCEGCTGQGITARTGTVFPVQCAGGCAEVLNSVPLWWGDRLAELPAVDVQLFHFTVEDAARCAAVMDAYRRADKPPAAITRGLYRRGVE